MNRPGHVSIRQRLLLISAAITLLTLLLASALLAFHGLRTLHDQLARDLDVLADVVGENCRSALLFDDPETARKHMETLSREYQIRFAVLYDGAGQRFAHYQRDSEHPVAALQDLAQTGPFDRLLVIERGREVIFDGSPIGRIFIHAHMDELAARLPGYLLAAGAALAVTLAFALLLTLRLQRRVSEPLLRLAATAQEISQRGDYGLRVTPPPGEDEIAILYREFNAMLGQIERRAAAEAKSRAKDIFLANMSHELRTPLNAVMGFAQLLEMDAALSDQQRRYVRDIQRGGQRLLELIADLLDLARIEVDRIEIVPVEWRPRELIEELEKTFRLKAERKGVALRIDVAAALPRSCLCDAKRLRQVLVNLLDNAIKFTDQGAVTLTVEYREGRFIAEVADTGPGIAVEKQGAIFEPFEQAGDRGQRAQGVGLGLAISKRLVERMGGTLQVESELGAGSRFRVELPAPMVGDALETLEQSAAPAPIAGYRRGRGQGPFRLLIVDDEADNRALLRGILERLGFTVEEAASGEACLSLVQATPMAPLDRRAALGNISPPEQQSAEHSSAIRAPDLILMDLRMPGLDGLETTRALRRIPEFSALPIVMVSAAAFPQDRANALAAGCDAALAKPVALEPLTGVIGQLLPLTWVHAEVEKSPQGPSGTEVLSPDQAQQLERLVRTGDIAAIQELAEGWLRTESCPGLAQRVAELAGGCDIVALRRLVRQYTAKD